MGTICSKTNYAEPNSNSEDCQDYWLLFTLYLIISLALLQGFFVFISLIKTRSNDINCESY